MLWDFNNKWFVFKDLVFLYIDKVVGRLSNIVWWSEVEDFGMGLNEGGWIWNCRYFYYKECYGVVVGIIGFY